MARFLKTPTTTARGQTASCRRKSYLLLPSDIHLEHKNFPSRKCRFLCDFLIVNDAGERFSSSPTTAPARRSMTFLQRERLINQPSISLHNGIQTLPKKICFLVNLSTSGFCRLLWLTPVNNRPSKTRRF